MNKKKNYNTMENILAGLIYFSVLLALVAVSYDGYLTKTDAYKNREIFTGIILAIPDLGSAIVQNGDMRYPVYDVHKLALVGDCITFYKTDVTDTYLFEHWGCSVTN